MRFPENEEFKLAAIATLASLFFAAVCHGATPAALGPESTQAELAAHVQFLSAPALKGRAPSTRGSRIARQYIETQFNTYGLVPWGKEKSFTVSFGYGKNIIGVLPGTEPNLAQQIVLVSAHYDHLGKDNKGRICAGAADDASGIAALLQTAKGMSLSPVKPKRSICFAAFDCEEKMLLGSFAFSCRKETQEAQIVAVINLDILGRDFLDAVPNTIFVTGAEHYPDLRRQLRASGSQAAIRVLPVGTDLVGPRGDHAAFESRAIPCLFFSSGLYRDYHKPSDTADKLDYAELDRAARVVLKTASDFASGASFRRSEATTDAEAEELQSVSAVMSEVTSNSSRAGIKPEQAAAFRRLARKAEDCLDSGQYDHQKRVEFVIDAVGILAPTLLPLEQMNAGQNERERTRAVQYVQYLQQFYIHHRSELMTGYGQFVAHLLKYRPGPFRGMPAWEYEIYGIEDEDIVLAERGDDRFALDVLLTPLTLKAQAKRSKILLESFSFGIFGGFEGLDCVGTRQQLADLCLLRLREEQTNCLHFENIRKVFNVVSGVASKSGYKELLAERLQGGGYMSESQWIASCIGSGIPALARKAIVNEVQDNDGGVREAMCKVIVDREMQADVRALAIERARPKAAKDVLLALCAVLDDAHPAFSKDFWPVFRPKYPFAERLEVKTMMPFFEIEAQQQSSTSRPIADLALAQLRKVTRQDFGKDPEKWRRWIATKAGERR